MIPPQGQGQSGSLRIVDSWGQDRLWKRVSTQGHPGSLRIAPIGWVGSFVESGPGSHMEKSLQGVNDINM